MFKKLDENDTEKWASASCAAHTWMGVEDFILEKLVDYCLKTLDGHISLHFDGIRIEYQTMCDAVSKVRHEYIDAEKKRYIFKKSL